MNSFSYLRIHDHKKTRKRLLLPIIFHALASE